MKRLTTVAYLNRQIQDLGRAGWRGFGKLGTATLILSFIATHFWPSWSLVFAYEEVAIALAACLLILHLLLSIKVARWNALIDQLGTAKKAAERDPVLGHGRKSLKDAAQKIRTMIPLRADQHIATGGAGFVRDMDYMRNWPIYWLEVDSPQAGSIQAEFDKLRDDESMTEEQTASTANTIADLLEAAAEELAKDHIPDKVYLAYKHDGENFENYLKQKKPFSYVVGESIHAPMGRKSYPPH